MGQPGLFMEAKCRGSTVQSLLHKLWLQMMSWAQEGRAHCRDIFASYLCREREQRGSIHLYANGLYSTLTTDYGYSSAVSYSSGLLDFFLSRKTYSSLLYRLTAAHCCRKDDKQKHLLFHSLESKLSSPPTGQQHQAEQSPLNDSPRCLGSIPGSLLQSFLGLSTSPLPPPDTCNSFPQTVNFQLRQIYLAFAFVCTLCRVQLRFMFVYLHSFQHTFQQTLLSLLTDFKTGNGTGQKSNVDNPPVFLCTDAARSTVIFTGHCQGEPTCLAL